MTGSPFSNVLGHNPGEDSTFTDVESTQVSDTTSETATRPQHSDGMESSVGVETDASGNVHVAGEDETQGQTDTTGNRTFNT